LSYNQRRQRSGLKEDLIVSTFLFAYRAPTNYTPSPETMAAWMAWFEGMGSSVAEIGNPIDQRSTVGNCGGDTMLGGYSLITAESLEAAVEMAKACPSLEHGGGIEVGQLRSLATTSGDSAVRDQAQTPA
jgi:hypothetical protein